MATPNLPVSFDKFKRDPMKAILYIAIVAIMYLYIDNRITYKNQIDYLMDQNRAKELKIEQLQRDVTALSIKIAEIKN